MITNKEALQAIRNLQNYCEQIDNHLPVEQKSGYRMIHDVVSIIDFIYDARHLQHGRWIDTDPEGMLTSLPWFKCSVCDKMASLEHMREWAYCPRCGSKMDEVSE